MRKTIITFLLALATSVWADESGSCGANLTWVYTESDHTLTISGTGDMYDYEYPFLDPEYPSNSAPWISYRYYISTIVLPNGLTSIGEYAFYGCGEYPGLNVTIPNTVTHINRYAFADCAWLLEITIPDGVVSIGEFAFEYCHLMKTLVIPASVTNIDMFAFQATDDLTDVTVNWTSLDGVTIGAYIFNAVITSEVNLHVPEGTEDMYAAASPWNAFNIVRPAASVTSVPSAITGLEYTGSAQELVNAGTASGGTLNYSLDNTNWSEDIPTGTNAGDYTVYYKVVGDESHADYTPDDNSVAVTIAPFMLTIQPIGEASFTVNTVQTATVYEVKQLIATETSIAAEYQRLIFAGKQLEDGRTLSEYNITNGTTVNLSYRIIVNLTANEDPNHAGDFYATFYFGSRKFALPDDGTEAYAAEVNGDAMLMHKIAENDEVLPANTAVIFKAPTNSITLTSSYADAVTVEATNNLHGVDADTEIASVVSGTCYVLSGGSNGVGFYLYEAPNQLKAHKAYIDWNAGSNMAQAPRRLRFVYDQATGIENGQMTNDERQTTKLLRDGQLIIIRNGVEYNAAGQRIK